MVALDAEHRQGAGDGLDALLRPQQPRQGQQVQAARDRRRELAARQPRDAGRLSAGLDVQGGDRRRPRSTPGSSRRTRPSAARTARRSPASRCNNFGGEDFGDITLTDALTHSVNTVWAEVGEKLGKRHDGQVHGSATASTASRRSTCPTTSCSRRASAARTASCCARRSPRIDVGRMAIGQDKLLVTPLQMATVAPTIANGGVRMKPHLDAEGRRPRRAHAGSRSSPRRPSA